MSMVISTMKGSTRPLQVAVVLAMATPGSIEMMILTLINTAHPSTFTQRPSSTNRFHLFSEFDVSQNFCYLKEMSIPGNCMLSWKATSIISCMVPICFVNILYPNDS
ncbi:hypothetical protein BDB00DRAFT_420432 [Zychaea mexicana]|uniref:uncharacterized protein n=1 Tax=Zychaea mexicana TaxID=64656 RepID=UPI0022FE87B2|nr:uncharacterized protein BDB00DRAFT_420432 [Zychaea mexicana]KAI9492677.1 hypothetical protein BDB00DRAFT_420432 [Zychaea mexicana]